MITNFCRSADCLLPLCPKCIRVHVDEHRASGTFAEVESIDLSIQEVAASLDSLSRIISKSGEELGDIQTEQEKVKQIIHCRLMESKARLVKEVERSIDKIEKTIFKQIAEYEERVGLELQDADYRLRILLGKLWKNQEDLQTERCMKTLILFHSSEAYSQIEQETESIQKLIQEIKDKRFDLVVD